MERKSLSSIGSRVFLSGSLPNIYEQPLSVIPQVTHVGETACKIKRAIPPPKLPNSATATRERPTVVKKSLSRTLASIDEIKCEKASIDSIYLPFSFFAGGNLAAKIFPRFLGSPP